MERDLGKFPLKNPDKSKVLDDKSVDRVLAEEIQLGKEGVDIAIMESDVKGAKKPLRVPRAAYADLSAAISAYSLP